MILIPQKPIRLYIHIIEYLHTTQNGDKMVVIIDNEKCGKIKNCPGAGLCIKICEKGALEEGDGEVIIHPEKCDNCDLCIQNCPNQAISKA